MDRGSSEGESKRAFMEGEQRAQKMEFATTEAMEAVWSIFEAWSLDEEFEDLSKHESDRFSQLETSSGESNIVK